MMKNYYGKGAEIDEEEMYEGSDDASEQEKPFSELEQANLSGRAKMEYQFEKRHRRFAQESLEAHNLCRVFHFTRPLELDKKMCKQSQIWAKYLAKLGQLESRYNCSYGENLFLIWPSKEKYAVKGGEPVDHWYSGIQDYSFGLDPNNLLCLQFTQIVWKDTTKLGVGIARGKDGKIFVVANYEPCGNVMGEFAAQVPPPGGYPEDMPWPVTIITPESVGRPFSASQRECLDLHNDRRRRHGVPLLTLNATLSKMATSWAKQLADEDRHAYRVDNPVGENVYSSMCPDPAMRSHIGVKTACDTWYQEIKFFEFGLEPTDIKARNFTQMVWRSTRYLGVGVARGRGGHVVVVANYYPRGNVVGQYRDNVPLPRRVPNLSPAPTPAPAPTPSPFNTSMSTPVTANGTTSAPTTATAPTSAPTTATAPTTPTAPTTAPTSTTANEVDHAEGKRTTV